MKRRTIELRKADLHLLAETRSEEDVRIQLDEAILPDELSTVFRAYPNCTVAVPNWRELSWKEVDVDD